MTERQFISVLIESPFSGDIQKNIEYATKAMNHARRTGLYVPFVPHLQWTMIYKDGCLQPVSDDNEEHRVLGREVSLAQVDFLRETFDQTLFYCDLGFSRGMVYALAKAIALQDKNPNKTYTLVFTEEVSQQKYITPISILKRELRHGKTPEEAYTSYLAALESAP